LIRLKLSRTVIFLVVAMSFANAFLNGDAYNNRQHPPYKYRVQPVPPRYTPDVLPQKASPLTKIGNSVVSPVAKLTLSPQKKETVRREISQYSADSIDLTKNAYPTEPVIPNPKLPSLNYGTHEPVNLSKGKPVDFHGNNQPGYYRAQPVVNKRQKNVENILTK
jgi:hypothetical protein